MPNSSAPEEPSAFDLARVDAGIASTRFAGQLHHLATVTSTNTLAVKVAQAGTRTGVWIADEQTAGRGRGGHTWHSSAGSLQQPDGLYLSALVRPALPLSRALWLSIATGLAARDAITATTGLAADIRWPNDLMLGKRKCGGILVETASDAAGDLRYAVIGIGINLNHRTFPPELEPTATSIYRETGTQQMREPLVIDLLQAIDREIALLEDPAESAGLLARFTAESTWVKGKRVHIQPSGQEANGYTGVTAGLDPGGFLLVVGDDGKLHTVLSGGVRET